MRHARPRINVSAAALVPLVFATLAGATVLLTPGPTESAKANGDTRTIHLYHAHTHESIAATYLVDGQYDSGVLEKLNWFLRDWRRDEPTKMDPRLFDVIWEVYRESGSSQAIEVMSAYRSPETNAMLRRRSRGVAEHSQHILGKAMDQHYMDVPMSRIREIAMKLERGGVGFYPTAGTPFVHMDVGGVRHWPRMSYDQLARLFPDGKTVHIPSNGQPLPRYEEARAELEARGDSFSYPTATEVKSKGFFAWLFGGGEDEGDTAAARDEGSHRGQTRVASLDRNAAASAGPAMMYGNHDKDAGVREFNLTGSTPQASYAPALAYAPSVPASPPQRRAVVPPPVQQAAAEPPRQVVSDAEAQDVLGRAMADPRQKAAVPVGASGSAPGQIAEAAQLHPAAVPAIALSVPMPPLRPVELASDGPRMPLPPGRPAEFMASNATKSDRAPGVNAPKTDAIGALIASATPTRVPALPNAITQGFGAAKPGGTPQVLAFASAGGSVPPARTYAPLPVARPSQFVAARLDRSNFRSLTASGPAARAIIHSGLGSAVTALRPAAQASLGTMVGQASSLAKGFGADATDLPSDRFSGPAVKSREHVVTSPSSGG